MLYTNVKNPNWHIAMATEFDALLRNKTRCLVPRTTSMNVVGFKWVFHLKYCVDGSLEWYKTHFVAKESSQ